MKLTDFTARVRLVLDMDNSEALTASGDTDAATLDAIIESNVIPAAKEIVSVAPARMLAAGAKTAGAKTAGAKTAGAKTEDITVTMTESHGVYVGTADMPKDFFRLLHVRMTSWDRPAAIISDSDAEYALQSSPWQGLRGNPHAPVAALVKDASVTSGYRLELYASGSKTDTLDSIGYVPTPEMGTDGELTIPGRVLDAAVYACASLTAETFGNASLAARLMSHAYRLAETATTNTAENNGDKE